MAHEAVTILGGGNTAFSVAANLTLRGYRVILYEIPGSEADLTGTFCTKWKEREST